MSNSVSAAVGIIELLGKALIGLIGLPAAPISLAVQLAEAVVHLIDDSRERARAEASLLAPLRAEMSRRETEASRAAGHELHTDTGRANKGM